MLRVLMLDLGSTLVDGGHVLPHVRPVLHALRTFQTADGHPLETCLVSDFHMPQDPQNEQQIESIFEQYVELLEGFDLRSDFEPVEERVTLSTQAGVHKPDRKIFELALQRLLVDCPLTDCLFITENQDHVQACREHLDMRALLFSPTGPGDFADWAEVPRLIADRIGHAIEENDAAVIGAELAIRQHLEEVTVRPLPDTDQWEAAGSSYVRLEDKELGDLSGVYVSLPVKLTLCRSGKDGNIEVISQSMPGEPEKREATIMLKSLLANGQVEIAGRISATASAESTTASQAFSAKGLGGPTHVVKEDEEGRKVLKRRGFSRE